MAEKGARPNVPRVQRLALRAVRAFSSPLLPDDYLELINPLWSTRELRGKIERIEDETETARTVVIKPGYGGRARARPVPAHRHRHQGPPPLARLLADVASPRARTAASRSRSRTSTRARSRPTSYAQGRAGTIVGLGGVEGDFVLPERDPREAAVHQRRQRDHADHDDAALAVAPRRDGRRRAASTRRTHEDDVIFGESCASSRRSTTTSSCTSSTRASKGRIEPAEPRRAVPGLEGARARSSPGPAEMLDAVEEHFERARLLRPALHMERFQPKLRRGGETGEGGTIKFLKSDCEAESDGAKPILVAGEEAGLDLPYGCREGICHTCVGTLQVGPAPRPAQRQGQRQRRRDRSAPASTRPRARRDRAVRGP